MSTSDQPEATGHEPHPDAGVMQFLGGFGLAVAVAGLAFGVFALVATFVDAASCESECWHMMLVPWIVILMMIPGTVGLLSLGVYVWGRNRRAPERPRTGARPSIRS